MRSPKSPMSVVLASIICLTLVSCDSKNPEIYTIYSPKQIAEIIISGQYDIPALMPLTPDDDLFADYLTSNYLLDAADFVDGAVYYAFGVEASEITVLQLYDAADMKSTTDALFAYKERRTAALTGYVPAQADLVERGVVVTNGAYAALLICEDTSSAESDFFSCFGKDPLFLPAEPLPLPERTQENDSDGDADGGAPGDNNGNAGVNENNGDNTGGELSSPDQAAIPNTDPGYNGNKPGTDWDTTPEPIGGETEPGDGAEDTPKDATENTNGSGNPAGNGSADPPETQESPTPSQPTPGPSQPPATPSPSPSRPPESPRPPEQSQTPQTVTDAFDPNTILAAWRTGNSSSLTEKNKAIYDACVEVIGNIITSGMTEYEKELAIHDWIVKWTSYDTEASNNSPTAKPSPDNDNPYGLFFNKKSICSGYTSTFQLFMDMLGIECITVNGYARNLQTEHAWNMVRLDGEWYCVDVTWDDPIGMYPQNHVSHDYFNVTSKSLRDRQHIWDESAYPEATATAYSYANMNRRQT